MKKLKLDIQMFGSTNKTTNYNLPQFIGTDKPTWLGDINEAMTDIDAAIHENATNISTMASDVASASATASKASQDVTGLTSTVNTLSNNVTTATDTANNAQSTATSALNTANAANGKADTNASDITAIQGNISEINSSITNINDNLEHLKDYSSNEAIIGLWIDGKPLYRKIFNYGQLPNNSSVGKAHNIPIDTPISVKGTVKTRSGKYNTWTIPSPNIFIDLSQTEVYIATNSDRSNLDGLVIIEYTKTTD